MPATMRCLSRGGKPLLALVWLLAAVVAVTYGAMQYIAPRGAGTLTQPRTLHVGMRQQMQGKDAIKEAQLKEGMSGLKGGGNMPEDPEAWTGGLFFALVLLVVMGSGIFGNGLQYSKLTEPLGNFFNTSGHVLSSLGVKVAKSFGEPVSQILPIVTAAGVVYVSSGRQITMPSADVMGFIDSASSGVGGDPNSLGAAWLPGFQKAAGKPGVSEELVPVTTVDRRYTTESQKCEPHTLQNDTDPTGGAIGVDMECDSKDSSGSWWRVKLTKKNFNGSFRAEVVEGNGAIWDEVWPGNCRPAVANYPSFELQQRDLPVFKPDTYDVSYFPPQELALTEDYPGKVYTDAMLLSEELPDPLAQNEATARKNIAKNYDKKWKLRELPYFYPGRDLPLSMVNELQKKKR